MNKELEKLNELLNILKSAFEDYNVLLGTLNNDKNKEAIKNGTGLDTLFSFVHNLSTDQKYRIEQIKEL